MFAKFCENQRKTVGEIEILKKYDNTSIQTVTYTISSTHCKLAVELKTVQIYSTALWKYNNIVQLLHVRFCFVH